MTVKSQSIRLAIVGNAGGTNVGDSLRRAGVAAGHSTSLFNSLEASAGSPFLRALAWRIDCRPPKLNAFSAKVVAQCGQAPPHMLVATGAAPLTASALRAIRALGVVAINYSTDDPWNSAMRPRWHLRALPAYDLVFTTRRSNLDDFRRLGCPNVHYLPFGYDERLYFRARITPTVRPPTTSYLWVALTPIARPS